MVSELWKIEVKQETDPFLSRVMIASDWNGSTKDAKEVFEGICRKWPKGQKVKFLVTCGGFIEFDWPESICQSVVEDNRKRDEVVKTLVEDAKRCAETVLNNDLIKKFRECTEYITLGMDSYAERENLRKPHIELVLVFDLKNDLTPCLFWTGKSYPTTKQQDGLVQIDPSTHFSIFSGEKTMVLGCHDLKVFDPRVYNRKNIKNSRKAIIEELSNLVKKESPTLILHHPHQTDCVEGKETAGEKAGKFSPGTWDRAWKDLVKIIPSIRYASAGRYWNNGKPKRSDRDKVLEKTKSCASIDFIIQKSKP